MRDYETRIAILRAFRLILLDTLTDCTSYEDHQHKSNSCISKPGPSPRNHPIIKDSREMISFETFEYLEKIVGLEERGILSTLYHYITSRVWNDDAHGMMRTRICSGMQACAEFELLTN
jgi:hypothetical protein